MSREWEKALTFSLILDASPSTKYRSFFSVSVCAFGSLSLSLPREVSCYIVVDVDARGAKSKRALPQRILEARVLVAFCEILPESLDGVKEREPEIGWRQLSFSSRRAVFSIWSLWACAREEKMFGIWKMKRKRITSRVKMREGEKEKKKITRSLAQVLLASDFCVIENEIGCRCKTCCFTAECLAKTLDVCLVRYFSFHSNFSWLRDLSYRQRARKFHEKAHLTWLTPEKK